MLIRFFRFIFIKHRWKTLFLVGLAILGYSFCLPNPLFKAPYSLVVLDHKGKLLGAKISTDGQWRFPPSSKVPKKFIQCITAYEDRRFYQHWGVDFRAIARALRDNWQAGKVKSGASTISMQVMRLAHKRQGRNWFSKLLESIQATRLEWAYSKDEIMALYAAHAPFGGNVVGLEAASWRYYGKAPTLLSWAEAATLAVLPNNPAIIHPGRNRQQLELKRNHLLKILLEQKTLDSFTFNLALQEPLPDAPLPLPSLAPHLVERINQEQSSNSKNSKINTTINALLQEQSQQLLQRYQQKYSRQGIHNMAAIIAEVETGKIISYVGNVQPSNDASEHGQQVDLIQAPRSSGSILKPLLYALMLEEGQLSPNSLVPDVPTSLHGYRPQNFHAQYDGVVQAGRALERSLNIPFVRMLQDYGVQKFHSRLRQMGLQSIHRPARHYGLSLILGGAEVKLEELAACYASMARSLRHFNQDQAYPNPQFHPLSYHTDFNPKKAGDNTPLLSAASIYLCFENMRRLERPISEGAWEYFQSARDIAWKTGTSFGFRDAWAVGLTNKYVIAVWVGNADGEGRPELVGVKTAAPLLFDLLELLPRTGEQWFEMPKAALKPILICKKSGYQATPDCPQQDSLSLPQAASSQLKRCPFHKRLHLDPNGKYQVHGNCEAPSVMLHKSWFILPPLEEHYYKAKDPSYSLAPPFREDCRKTLAQSYQPMELIYPKHKTTIYLPLDYDGQRSKTVFKATHRHKNAVIHWHLDHAYIGSTQEFHQMELQPETGEHQILLVDEDGQRLEQIFSIRRGTQ